MRSTSRLPQIPSTPCRPVSRPVLYLLGAALLAGAGSAAPPKGRPTPKAKPKPRAAKPKPSALDPSLVPATAPDPRRRDLLPPNLILRTDAEYDPRLDVRPDSIAVAKTGTREDVDRALQSWKLAGFTTYRLFPLSLDPGSAYTAGKVDGMMHTGDLDLDLAERPLSWRDHPVVFPTPGWTAYLKDQIRQSIDAGGDGVWLSEPGLPSQGGYGPAFKAAWAELFQSPWQAPRESPAQFFRASRLRADLSLKLLDELRRHTHEYGMQKNRDAALWLAADSPLNYGRDLRVFPHAAASRLPIAGLVAQIRPDLTPHSLEGRTEPHPFEMAWLASSYFANLAHGLADKPLYYLTDPGSDARSTAEALRSYRSLLAAALFFPQARGIETVPFPERLYAAAVNPMAASSLSESLTLHTGLSSAVKELMVRETLDGAGSSPRGIGVLTLDTLQWQRGGPQGSSMRSLDGLTLPLLQRGIPVELVPGERSGEPGYLSRFKVLLLSYDMQKPLGPELHQDLAAWVRAGGVLVVLGGEDSYNTVGEWWNRNGFPSPTDHLFRAVGAGIDLGGRTARRPEDRYREALRPEVETRKVHPLPLGEAAMGGKLVYLRFTDARPGDAGGLWLGRVRVLDGGKVRADFTAGSVAERPFLVENVGSQGIDGGRAVEGDGSFVYRFARLGPTATLELELSGQSRVSLSLGDDPAVNLQPIAAGLPPVRAASAYPVVSYPLAGAEPLYRIAGTPETDPVPAFRSPIGQGAVLYYGLPAASLADSAPGANLLRELVRQACVKAGVPYTEGPLVARRGPYVVAHALGRSVQLSGQYLDLFKHELPLLENPTLPYGEPVLLKQVDLRGRTPTLLHASHRARIVESTSRTTRLTSEGPTGTWSVVRVFTAGFSLAGVEAADLSGRFVQTEARIEGTTLRVRFPQMVGGVNLNIRWNKPEARLTK